MSKSLSYIFRFPAIPVLLTFCLLLVSAESTAISSAQNLSLAGQFGNRGAGGASDEQVTFSAEFKMKPDSRVGMLSLTATIEDGWHFYSVTQKPGGPTPSKITVAESEKHSVTGDFQPDVAAEVTETDLFDVPVEEHHGTVVWSAPIRLAAGVDPKELHIELSYKGLRCSDAGQCFPIRPVTVAVSYGGEDKSLIVPEPPKSNQAKPQKKTEPFRPEYSHLTLSGKIVAADDETGAIKPGDTVTLQITAELDDDYHIYAYQPKNTDDTRSTLFAFSEDNGWKISEPTASVETQLDPKASTLGYYEPVTFSFDVKIPADVEAKSYKIAGLMGFLTCAKTCDGPEAAAFSVQIPVSSAETPIFVSFNQGESYAAVEKQIKQNKDAKAEPGTGTDPKPENTSTNDAPTAYDVDTPEQVAEMLAMYQPEPILILDRKATTIWTALFGAFIGGMLLNLMPCVFPVLGLKVMGFVEQAGSDPKKIRIHGIVFTLGLVASMWVLASIILILKNAYDIEINWGTQMGNPYFVVSIIVLLFLLGLNMAGVFEIGTSLTRVGGSTQGKKGYTSSFLSGVLTTLIATPCSGPFLGVAMAYTFSQTAVIAMFLFTIFALGIAFPYIVLAFFPALINRLPRPGAWMHTFKVTMAFALFATVAFFMQTFGAQTGVDGLSWLVMALVVLGLAAFFYGTWSPAFVKPLKRFAFGFVLPAAIALTGGWMCYGAAQYRQTASTVHQAGDVPWQKWHPGKIEYMLKNDPQIIWVDYTAKWCSTCLSNKHFIFSDPRVLARIEELNVQLVKVDDTLMEERIRVDLARTGRVTIPVNLFYPPNYPAEPATLLEAVITPSQALKALDRMEKVQKKWREEK